MKQGEEGPFLIVSFYTDDMFNPKVVDKDEKTLIFRSSGLDFELLF